MLSRRGWILSRSSKDERMEICAFFGALCLFLSAVEYLIPKPLPFFRLGLANLPIILALRFLKPVDLILVILLKILGQALLNGTLASYVFLFSAAGTLISAATMFGVYRLGGRHVSLIGVSLVGALASSSIQVVLAIAFIFGEKARIIAPLSIGSGVAAGLFIGIFAERFVLKSTWLRQIECRYTAKLD